MADDLTERVARAVFDRDNDTWRPSARDRMWPSVREEYLPYGRDIRAVVAGDVDGIAGALWPIEEFEFTWAEAVRSAENYPAGYYAAMVRTYRDQARKVAAYLRGADS